MLVLSRKVGQSIVIDGAVKVQVVEVNGNKVRLGVVCDREIDVDREEIHLLKMADQREAVA